MMILANLTLLTAAGLLLVLTIDVIGVMPRRGCWPSFALWVAIGGGALLTGAQLDRVPLPVTLLLLALALLLWRQRGRLRWAAQRGLW